MTAAAQQGHPLRPHRPTTAASLGIWLIAVISLYFLAGKLGLSLAFVNASASPVWPPTGLAIVAVVLLGPQIAPAIAVGALLVNLTTSHDIPSSLQIALGNTLEALAGAALLNRLAGERQFFRSAQNIFRYVFIAALPATCLCATIGTAALLSRHLAQPEQLPTIALTWWLGDFVSALVIVPLLLIWITRPAIRWNRPRISESLLLLVLTILLAEIVFSGWTRLNRNNLPLAFLTIPLFVWGAFRFYQHGSIAVSFVISAIAIAGTLRGSGPFAISDRNSALLLLQSFIGIVTITALVLAALVSERAAAEETLRHSEQRLRLALDEREASLARERSARDQAERASQAKDQFLAVLSHELRTPLMPVLLLISAMERDSTLPAQVREDLATARRSVELEARLIDDLLDLTRISRGKLTLNLNAEDLHVLIQRAIDICAHEESIQLNIDLTAPHHHIKADPARMQQVFWNLLTNALKFTRAGGAVTIRSHNPDDHSIAVEVIDTGIGIAPEMLPRLFNAFEQVETASTRQGGLGLGLSIGKALVLAHNGILTARSEGANCGATFTVVLPTIAVPAPTNSYRDQSTHEANALKILLVEDHGPSLAVLTKILRAHHHNVTTATTIAAAHDLIEHQRFDLLISDLGLPDGSGYDLMRHLRAKNGTPGIALSGYGMNADIRKSLDAGFAEHLTKPLTMTTLQATIARVTAPKVVSHES